MDHFKGMKSPPQLPLPIDKVVWSGQAVVAVVADTRALAEDAAEAVAIEFEELPAVVDIDARASPVRRSSLRSWAIISASTARSTPAVSTTSSPAPRMSWRRNSHFGRHTAVTLEPRAIVADYDASEPR